MSGHYTCVPFRQAFLLAHIQTQDLRLGFPHDHQRKMSRFDSADASVLSACPPDKVSR